MIMTTNIRINRRQFFEKLGKSSLVVGFSLSPVATSILAEGAHAASLNSSFTILSGIASGPLAENDAWITIDHQGNITLFSGKVELGTGTQTAFSQIVAEELYVDVTAITYVQGDTSQTPDQGTTAGSKSVQTQGPLVRRAAATAHQALLSLASTYLGASSDQLVAQGGSIGIGAGMKRPTTYAKLFDGQQISITSNSAAPFKAANQYTVVGKLVPRVDLFDKFTGKFTYVSDVVVPGMLHGRVVRNDYNSSTGLYTSKPKNAIFKSLDDSAAQAVPGFVKTIQKGNFVGIVATTEWGAIQAARGVHVTWQPGAVALASDSSQPNLLQALKAEVYANSTQEVVGNAANAFAAATGAKLTDTFYSPYQMHGSVGPCCAVANVTAAPDANGIQATVWSGTQGVYPLQTAVAQILGLNPSLVRIIYVEGAGCYGHNGADDVAVDAALMSQAVGAPVRVQWMRQDEHGWEPLGPAMAHTMAGALDASGNVVAWIQEVWTPPHSSRPGGAGSLLAGQETGLLPPNLPTAPVNQGTRNAPVNYKFPAIKLTAHHVQPYLVNSNGSVAGTSVVNTLPRSSALRSLGGMSNCFANESFMDELVRAAHADPVAFRNQYVCTLNPSNSGSATAVPGALDQRGMDALTAMAAQAGTSLAGPTRGDRVGKGIAFARYETVETYVAVYAEVEVTSTTGAVWVRRVVVAHDCGLIINPDGLKNQIEGNVIQGISRTLIEEVQFNTSGVTSLTWAFQVPAYPVIHFNQVPASIEIVLLNHPEQLMQIPDTPAWGAGEPTIGPVAPAIANAIYDAIGKRMTVLPITPARIKAALAS
jgi:nicotinate dehydrogenase subunit B